MRHAEKNMKGSIGDPNVLRLYLLGDLDDDAALSQIEERLMTDVEYLSQIEGAEQDLIEDYLDGQLKGDDKERFEKFFLLSAGRQQQMRLTKSLREFSTKAAAGPERAKRSWFGWVPTLSTPWLRS
jgi:hypothetical protein